MPRGIFVDFSSSKFRARRKRVACLASGSRIRGEFAFLCRVSDGRWVLMKLFAPWHDNQAIAALCELIWLPAKRMRCWQHSISRLLRVQMGFLDLLPKTERISTIWGGYEAGAGNITRGRCFVSNDALDGCDARTTERVLGIRATGARHFL